MLFFTYGDEKFAKELDQMYKLCKAMDTTVGELYHCITTKPKGVNLFSHISKTLFEVEMQDE